MIATPLGKAIFQSRGRPPVFLLRDDFTTDAAAPLTSPRPAEPGPGTLTITDTTNKLSVASGQLVAVAGGGQPNPGIWSGTALARVAGRALVARVNPVTSGYDVIGFSTTSASASGNVSTVYFYGTTLALGEMAPHSVGTYVANTSYQIATILRSLGAFVFIKGGVFTNWTLLMVHVISSVSPLYAKWHSDNPGSNFKIDLFRVLDLPAPFDSDYGLATQRTASPSANATIVSEANAVVEFTWTAVTGETVELSTRRTDDNDRWITRGDQVGSTIKLMEVVGGVETERGSAAQTWTNTTAYRMVVSQDGTIIRVYVANVLKITYSSASSNSSATGIKTNKAGANLVSWSRTLIGTPATYLDAAVA